MRQRESMKLKAALLISYSEIEPFPRIRESSERQAIQAAARFGIDVYYVVGEKPSFFNRRYSKVVEFYRFTSVGLFFLVLDKLYFHKMKTKIFSFKTVGNDFCVHIPDELRYLGLKMLTAYEYMLDNDYDVVIKTTVSSVFNFSLLSDHLKKIDFTQDYYAGNIVSDGSSSFASGASLVMNKITLKKLISNRNLIDHSRLDDVAIGNLMLSLKIIVKPIRSENIINKLQAERLSRVNLKETIHYRCKDSAAVRNDHELMSIVRTKIGESNSGLFGRATDF
jgi:hypothetical protein